jgi:hypothetical protein
MLTAPQSTQAAPSQSAPSHAQPVSTSQEGRGASAPAELMLEPSEGSPDLSEVDEDVEMAPAQGRALTNAIRALAARLPGNRTLQSSGTLSRSRRSMLRPRIPR